MTAKERAKQRADRWMAQHKSRVARLSLAELTAEVNKAGRRIRERAATTTTPPDRVFVRREIPEQDELDDGPRVITYAQGRSWSGRRLQAVIAKRDRWGGVIR